MSRTTDGASPAWSDAAPLRSLDQWEEHLLERYPAPGSAIPTGGPAATGKPRDDYRNYDEPARDTVREFYRLNHRHQCYDFVLAKEREFLGRGRARMSVWEALAFLDTLVDDSDPDLSLTQLQHLLQTSEAIRADGQPDWFVLTGLIHDLGKILCLWGEPQWAVVGDTFPVGCRFSEKIVYPELFADNPDRGDDRFQSESGVYEAGAGLRSVHMSWGHDEYLYHVVKDHLPEPALYMIRYHSFYSAHREGAYQHLMDDHDRKMFAWVRAFNPYDLYSKSEVPPDAEALEPYYRDLVAKYLPPILAW
jgi:inositol oxygenase